MSGQLYAFNMESHGRGPLVEILKKGCMAPECLRLKVGAKVMFVKNNFEEGYANGTLGKVISCSYDGPRVMLTSGKVINVEKTEWTIEEEGKKKATIEQFPLRLAWAITVHKSQGMSLDAVEVDLSKSFERGMGYVALSRVRTLEGLRLIGLNDNALQVRGDVIDFDEDLKEQSKADRQWLNSLTDKEIKEDQELFLKKIAPLNNGITSKKGKKIKKNRVAPIEQTKIMLEQGMGLKEIINIRGLKQSTILDHIEKLLVKYPDLEIKHLRNELTVNKFKKAWMCFRENYGENREYLLAPIKNKLGDSFTYEELRIVRLFVKKNL